MTNDTSHNTEPPLLNGEVVQTSGIVPSTSKKKKKPTKRKPTAKQKALADLLLNNPENKSLRKLMVQAGYSPSSADQPAKITEKPSFIQLMDSKGMSDDRLTEVLSDGLSAMDYVKTERVEGVGKNRLKTEVITPVPSLALRHKYLETALKVKGMTNKPEKPSGDTYNTFIQQNNIDPNSAGARTIVDNTLDMLMEQTKQA